MCSDEQPRVGPTAVGKTAMLEQPRRKLLATPSRNAAVPYMEWTPDACMSPDNDPRFMLYLWKGNTEPCRMSSTY